MNKEMIIANILEWQTAGTYSQEELESFSLEELQEIYDCGWF